MVIVFPSYFIEITRLLLFAAQASHDQVPPDVRLKYFYVNGCLSSMILWMIHSFQVTKKFNPFTVVHVV